MRIPQPRIRLGTKAFTFGSFLLVLVVAAQSGGCGSRSLFEASAISTEKVRSGAFVRRVSARGELKATNATPITVPVEAGGPQNIAWLADDGSKVEAGDPVIEFDPYEAEKQLADGQSDRDSASQKIKKARSESSSTVQTLEIDTEVAEGELDRAEQFAPKDGQLYSRNEIIESEIDRDLLTKRAETAEARADATEERGETDLAITEIEMQKAQIRIRQAEKSLASLKVLAPHEGYFTLRRSWRGTVSVGETVWPSQPIAEIPDLSEIEARVYVLEADAGGLKAGCPATVTVEGRPGAVYPGEVKRVDAIAKTKDWRVPTKFFETIISLETTDPEMMKPGQSVRAEIVLEELDNVMSVPRQAVFEKEGDRIVYRNVDGRLETVEVEVGAHSLSRVVISSGLAEGDLIALRDPNRTASDIFSGEAAAAGSTGAATTTGGSP